MNMKILNAWICKISNENVEPVFGNLTIEDGKISAIDMETFEPERVFNKKAKEK